MPLSWNEIRHHAIAFSREWQDETREAAEHQSFWNDFFNVFGVVSTTMQTHRSGKYAAGLSQLD